MYTNITLRRVRTPFCSRKAISITYSECGFMALGVQHVMRHIVICGLLHYTVFFHVILYTKQFRKKIIKNRIRFLIFSTILFRETFLILRRNDRDMIEIYIGLHVKYRLFLSDFKELEFSRQNFEKYSNIKFHKNPSRGSRVVA